MNINSLKINELTEKINRVRRDLQSLLKRGQRISFDQVDSDIINDLLVNKISQNSNNFEKNLNSLKNDYTTINQLKDTSAKNEQEISVIYKNILSLLWIMILNWPKLIHTSSLSS